MRPTPPMPPPIPPSALRAAYRLVTLCRPAAAAPYRAPAAPQLFDGQGHTASQGAAQTEIPRILWTYWNDETLDPMVEQCIHSWRLHCPDFEVRVLSARNLHRWVDAADLPASFAALHPTKQSDWLRLYVVHRWGGYWLDASTLLTRPLAWLDTLRQAQGAEFAGFFLRGFTQDPRFPVVESWAFGAPAGSAFMAAWQQEFDHALVGIGTQGYLDALRALPESASVLQGIADPEYLLIHVTAQRVLQRPNPFRLALLPAEDTAYCYQNALSWKWYLLYTRLCLVRGEAEPAPLVKLRGGERRHFAQMLAQHGGPLPGSVWHTALGARAGRAA